MPAMIKSFLEALYPNQGVSFQSDYPLDLSVTKLRIATKSSFLASLFKQSAVGTVKPHKVRLQRVVPLFGNSFKPIFVGRFAEERGQVTLVGAFTTFAFSKIFITIWFGFISLWTLGTTISVIVMIFRNPDSLVSADPRFSFPLFGFSMLFVGYLFLRICWWLSREDIRFLSNVIQTSLNKPRDPDFF